MVKGLKAASRRVPSRVECGVWRGTSTSLLARVVESLIGAVLVNLTIPTDLERFGQRHSNSSSLSPNSIRNRISLNPTLTLYVARLAPRTEHEPNAFIPPACPTLTSRVDNKRVADEGERTVVSDTRDARRSAAVEEGCDNSRGEARAAADGFHLNVAQMAVRVCEGL